MKKIVFVTGNKGKVETAKRYFNESEILLECCNYNIEEPTVNDIEFIAKSKVTQAYDKVGVPCIALDCGFYIPNYPNNPNFPGAFPKRELLEKIGIDGLLQNMKDVENRECYFKECLAYNDGTTIKYFYGISKGILAKSIRGNDSNSKWSDLWLVFIPDNCTKTLAEMTDDERINRPDNHTNAIDVFAKWFNEEID